MSVVNLPGVEHRSKTERFYVTLAKTATRRSMDCAVMDPAIHGLAINLSGLEIIYGPTIRHVPLMRV